MSLPDNTAILDWPLIRGRKGSGPSIIYCKYLIGYTTYKKTPVYHRSGVGRAVYYPKIISWRRSRLTVRGGWR